MNKTTKRLVIALSMSVALNLFFTGFMTARVVFGRGGHGRGGEVMGHNMWRSKGMKGKIRQVMHENRAAMQVHRRSLRQARQAAHDALVADDFDRAALAGAFAQVRQRATEAQAAMHDVLAEAADALPVDQRRRLARRLRRQDRLH